MPKYIKDRYSIRCDSELQELLQIIASTIGSPTNPSKLENTFKSVKNVTLSSKTINTYLSYLEDAFLIEKSIRYDIKGKKYINTRAKHYFTDMGIRNAILGFRKWKKTILWKM